MIYDMIAPIYDAVNDELDYSAWADFIEKIVDKYGKRENPLVLDLACGTGRMTAELASRGFDMIGVDYSAEMLGVARERAEKSGKSGDILWLCQDMRNFELYGTVGLAISCLDSINHLTKSKDLSKCFSLVHNYLDPDGLFVFDVNGKMKFENVYGTRSYVMENEGDFCVWQNYYDAKSRICNFYITLFKEMEDGLYERFEEVQQEKMYTLRSLKKHLLENGFEFIGAYSDFDFSSGSDEDERIYIVARCKK